MSHNGVTPPEALVFRDEREYVRYPNAYAISPTAAAQLRAQWREIARHSRLRMPAPVGEQIPPWWGEQ